MPRRAHDAAGSQERSGAATGAEADSETVRARLDELSQDVAALAERLRAVERGERPGAAVSARALPGSLALQNRLRGPSERIRERQAVYVADFADAAPVLDLGSGRGEFLELLAEAGVEARGVDANADLVSFATSRGCDVDEADAVEYLEELDDGSLGGIFAAQLVEHLPAPALLRLLALAVAKLRPGGLLVAETINPLSPLALRNFFADLTHAHPLVPETLALLAEAVGFGEIEIRFVNPPPPEERLRPVDLPRDLVPDEARDALTHNLARLNELLFAPLDYALVARA